MKNNESGPILLLIYIYIYIYIYTHTHTHHGLTKFLTTKKF